MKEIRKSLGRIEGQLDLLVPVIQDHGSRLRSAEKKLSYFGGILATLVALPGALLAWVKWG